MPEPRRRLRSNTTQRKPKLVQLRVDLQLAIERLGRVSKTYAAPMRAAPVPVGPTRAIPATTKQEPAAKALFEAAFGSLKGKNVFGNDAVEFQREIRDEWR